MKLSATVSLLMGLTVIVGWFVGSSTIVQLHASFVRMQFNTALCFALVSSALLAAALRRKVPSIFFAASAGLLTAMTLSQYVFSYDLGLDEFFMTHDITTKTSHPGRMAPSTAICFIIAAFATTCAAVNNPRR